jgi:hypothetical protein
MGRLVEGQLVGLGAGSRRRRTGRAWVQRPWFCSTAVCEEQWAVAVGNDAAGTWERGNGHARRARGGFGFSIDGSAMAAGRAWGISVHHSRADCTEPHPPSGKLAQGPLATSCADGEASGVLLDDSSRWVQTRRSCSLRTVRWSRAPRVRALCNGALVGGRWVLWSSITMHSSRCSPTRADHDHDDSMAVFACVCAGRREIYLAAGATHDCPALALAAEHHHHRLHTDLHAPCACGAPPRPLQLVPRPGLPDACKSCCTRPSHRHRHRRRALPTHAEPTQRSACRARAEPSPSLQARITPGFAVKLCTARAPCLCLFAHRHSAA